MKILKVKTPGGRYDIIIESGIIEKADKLISSVSNPKKIMIVTDENVDKLYGESVYKTLQNISEVKKIVLPAGEKTKSLDNLKKLYDEAFDFKMTRKDLVVALGGGVIGDLAGFFASTLYRGIDIIQIPTTLLSQVDSSVGGKTAVDVLQGKNLVGSFYQPKRVIIDTKTLETLPDRDFFGGLSEVIKYGAIMSKKLFAQIEEAKDRSELMEKIESIVYSCCDIKRRVVKKDEHDVGLRMVLNFGHTVGHIVEKAYNYTKYTHGEAIAFGMIVASRLGERLGTTKNGTAKRIENIVRKFSLPSDIMLNKEELLNIGLDKKTLGSDITVILLKEIGKFSFHKMPVYDFIKAVNEECENGSE